jgi:hypothetical protein
MTETTANQIYFDSSQFHGAFIEYERNLFLLIEKSVSCLTASLSIAYTGVFEVEAFVLIYNSMRCSKEFSQNHLCKMGTAMKIQFLKILLKPILLKFALIC